MVRTRRSLIGAVAGLSAAALVTGCGHTNTSTPAVSSSATWSTPASPASPASTPTSSVSTASSASASSPAASSSSASASTSAGGAGQSCGQLAASLSLPEQVGQLYMVGLNGSSLDAGAAAQLRDLHLGSALVLENPPSGVQATAALSAQVAAAGGAVPVLVATDHEGGTVQRLRGAGFTTIPSATEQATWTPTGLTASWRRWGGQLAQAGVHYDLAPVTDLVSPSAVQTNDPIGKLRRNYGTSASSITSHVPAVLSGLQSAGVATAVKHFPGLGAVTTNTDMGVATDTTTTTSSASVAAFKEVMASNPSSVMVSNAIYTQIDPNHPAVFSSAIIQNLLRGQLGWQGVVISDDLGAAGAVASTPAAERGTDFLRAGGDIAIDASQNSIAAMVNNTVQAATGDQTFAQAITQKATRVLSMKASVGQVSCHV